MNNKDFELEPGDIIVERGQPETTDTRWLYLAPRKWLIWNGHGWNRFACVANDRIQSREYNGFIPLDVYRDGVKVYPVEEKHLLRIEITGVANCGKSVISEIIETALKDYGIEVDNQDTGAQYVRTNIDDAVGSIAKKSRVVIECTHARRMN